MNRFFEKRLANWQCILISVFSAMAILLFIVVKLGGCYETNNDRIINEIFSGTMTGTPDAHAIYVNYILGIIFSGLYSITKAVPWWGLFLLSCYALINIFVLTALLKRGKTLKEQLFFYVLGCGIILTNLYIFSALQYTTIAGALAVAGYVWILLDKHPVRRYIVYGLFEVLAVFLRRDSMLMVQPIGMCVVAAYLLLQLFEKRSKIKQCMLELVRCCLVIAIAFSCHLVGNYIIGDYSATEWEEYIDYNDTRMRLIDYYGYPEYEECKDILDKYGVSELEYHAVRRYYILDNALEIACMDELGDMAEAQYYKEHPFSLVGLIKRMLNYFRYDECFGYEIAVPLLYFFVCIWFALGRRWKYFLPVGALLGSRYLIFAYLIFKGRITHGVINILFFAELFLLLAIFVKSYHSIAGEAIHVKAKAVLFGVFVCVIPLAVNHSYKEAKGINESTRVYEKAIMKLYDYIEQQNCGFIVGDEITTYYCGMALDTRRYQHQNSLVTGGWFYNSPMMNEAVETYKQKYADNMKCIIFSDVPGFDQSYVFDILHEKYGVDLELTDTLHLEELGLNYEIYQLSGAMK